MAIPAMALLQQHDARRDVVIELAARRRAAIEVRGISNCGRSELGAQSGRKNPPACRSVCLSVCQSVDDLGCQSFSALTLLVVAL